MTMGSVVFDLSLGNKSIHKEWTYKDLNTSSFGVKTNNRDIKTKTDAGAIQNSINNIFLFIKGERIILPDFGNSLYEFLYEPVNDITAKAIGKELSSLFEKWEPRITVTKILITPYPDDNAFQINISYYIPSLNDNKLLSFNTAINQRT